MSDAEAALDPIEFAISVLLSEASHLVPIERGHAAIRKWLQFDRLQAMPIDEQSDRAEYAVTLMSDLMLAQPSASGATAFDRLAKKRGAGTGPEAAALSALRSARYRLLRAQTSRQVPSEWFDEVAGEALHIAAADFPYVEPGTHVFARVAILPDGRPYFGGIITPLDADAYAVALAHPARGNKSPAANARWAEAIYVHVLRHGTLEIPGLNVEDPEPELDDPFADLVSEWVALEEDQPDASLVQRTRQSVSVGSLLAGLIALLGARQTGQTAVASALQRMMLIFMETVARREAIGSHGLALDDIDRVIEASSAPVHLKPELRALFKTLRSFAGAPSRPHGLDDASLVSLMQRIQGLRAKTVDQGCTEAEALAAAKKVAELLDRYGLSLSDLDFRAQACDGIAVQTTRRRVAALDTCVPTIANFFDCRVWAEHAKGEPFRYIFFGLRADVAAAQYLYELIERTIVTETDAFRSGKLYASMKGERRSATASFQTGLATGICNKLTAIQAARNEQRRSESGRDLVLLKDAVVDEEVDKLGLALQVRTLSRARSVLTTAYDAGTDAGARFEYAPALHRTP